MNRRTFLVALALVGCLGLWVVAQDDPARRGAAQRPRSGPEATSQPAWRIYAQSSHARHVLARLKKDSPEMYQQLEALHKKHPREYVRELWEFDRFYRLFDALPPGPLRESFMRIRRDNVRIVQLAKEYRENPPAKQKTQIRKEISDLVARQFDDRQKIAQFRVDQLTKKLEDLKKQLAARKHDRDKLIAERVKTVLEPKSTQQAQAKK